MFLSITTFVYNIAEIVLRLTRFVPKNTGIVQSMTKYVREKNIVFCKKKKEKKYTPNNYWMFPNYDWPGLVYHSICSQYERILPNYDWTCQKYHLISPTYDCICLRYERVCSKMKGMNPKNVWIGHWHDMY